MVVNLRGVNEAFRRAPGVFLRELNVAVKEEFTEIRREAQRVHRFKSRSRTLARSIKSDIKSIRDINRGVFLDTGIAKYGPYVHEGTRPHTIKPKGKYPLRWPSKKGKAIFIRAWKVQHPGTPPDQFLYQAADRREPAFRARIDKAIESAIIKLGFK